MIGYFTFSHGGDYGSAFGDIRQYLDEYVYDKIWIELTDKETSILSAIALDDIYDVRSLKEKLDLKPNEFSVYRDRLIKKGILDGSKRGRLTFTLPFFDEYIREHNDDE